MPASHLVAGMARSYDISLLIEKWNQFL